MTAVREGTAPPSTADPRPRRGRTVAGWSIVVALVLLVSFAALRVAATGPAAQGALDPEGAGEGGALALAEILREQGVDVSVYRSRAEARAAIDQDATLVMTNPYTLTDEALETLMEPAERVVFLSAGTHLLNTLKIGENATGALSEVTPGCDLPEFAEVGSIRADRLFSPADGVQACFRNDEGAAVLVDARSRPRQAVVEGTRLFDNEGLAEDGNAALALALLAQTDRVVWYVPNFADSDIEGETVDTLGSLTPPWVTPAILLLIAAGIAAAIPAAISRRMAGVTQGGVRLPRVSTVSPSMSESAKFGTYQTTRSVCASRARAKAAFPSSARPSLSNSRVPSTTAWRGRDRASTRTAAPSSFRKHAWTPSAGEKSRSARIEPTSANSGRSHPGVTSDSAPVAFSPIFRVFSRCVPAERKTTRSAGSISVSRASSVSVYGFVITSVAS